MAVTAGQQSLTPVREPLPLASVANRAPSLPPIALPLVVPIAEGAPNKKRGAVCALAGGNGGRERSVHIGTTKD